jgi:hypothetical protein
MRLAPIAKPSIFKVTRFGDQVLVFTNCSCYSICDFRLLAEQNIAPGLTHQLPRKKGYTLVIIEAKRISVSPFVILTTKKEIPVWSFHPFQRPEKAAGYWCDWRPRQLTLFSVFGKLAFQQQISICTSGERK